MKSAWGHTPSSYTRALDRLLSELKQTFASIPGELLHSATSGRSSESDESQKENDQPQQKRNMTENRMLRKTSHQTTGRHQ